MNDVTTGPRFDSRPSIRPAAPEAKRPEPSEPVAPERDPTPMPPEINPPTSHPHPDPAQPVT